MQMQKPSSPVSDISLVGSVRKKMLPFFPSGFPDELFVSRISIYHIIRGHSTAQETFAELFDSGKFSLTHSVPQHIDRLAERIPGERQAVIEDIYRQSTLLPLFELFGGKKLIGETGLSSFHRRIVGSAGATYVCPECLREDRKKFGTPYLHRSHKIPTSTCCWKHGLPLISRCPECRCPIEPPTGLILAPWKGCDCGLQYHEIQVMPFEPTDAEKALAKFGHELLNCPPDVLGLPNLIDVYRGRARALGFSRGSKVDRIKLMAAIEAAFGKSLLANIDWSYRKQCTTQWLHIFDTPSVIEASVSRHLILGAFLYEDAAALLADLRKLADQGRKQESVPSLPAKKEETIDASPARRFDPEAMLDRVVRAAKKNNLSVEALWSAEFASMKRLVRCVPGVIGIIEARLKQPADSRINRRMSKSKSMPSPEADVAWAEMVRNAGAELHADTDKPQRITKNQLLRRASRRVWPTVESFPLTHALCESFAESQWHFYGRRLLWTMVKYAGRSASKSMLVEECGLEIKKAGDVLDYLLKCDCRPTKESYSLQLEKLGIPNNWKGPHPDRQYPKVGRKYVRKDLRSVAQKGLISGDHT